MEKKLPIEWTDSKKRVLRSVSDLFLMHYSVHGYASRVHADFIVNHNVVKCSKICWALISSIFYSDIVPQFNHVLPAWWWCLCPPDTYRHRSTHWTNQSIYSSSCTLRTDDWFHKQFVIKNTQTFALINSLWGKMKTILQFTVLLCTWPILVFQPRKGKRQGKCLVHVFFCILFNTS